MIPPFNDIDVSLRHQVYLEGLKTQEVNQFTAFLQQMRRHIRAGLDQPDVSDRQQWRLQRLLRAVDGPLSALFQRYYTELSGRLIDLAHSEGTVEANGLKQTLIASPFETEIPTRRLLRAAALTSPLAIQGPDRGKLLAPFIQDWTRQERRRVQGAIRLGVAQGQTHIQIVQAICGTSARQFRDGLLATTQRHAAALVRTCVQHISSAARCETWRANSPVITGYRWVSTLDGRTSLPCQALDGRVFPLDQGPQPPLHIGCRSSTVAELDPRFDFLKKGRSRATQSGPASAKMTYYDWLKQQPTAFQDDVLGPTRGQLLRQGGLSAQRFSELSLDRQFAPLTLKEMQQRNPHCFDRAFS